MLQAEKKSSRVASRSPAGGARLLMLAAILLSTPLAAWSARTLVAKPAPDFALKSLTGENLRLSEYRGEVVLVNFWASWCGRCRKQLSVIDELYLEHQGPGFQVLSVNIDDDPDEAREASSGMGLQAPVLLDDQKTVSRLYHLGTLPVTVLVDHHGTVRRVYTGYRHGDEEIYRTELEKLLAE